MAVARTVPFINVFLFVFLAPISCLTMKRRLENLEMHVNSNSLQTRRDIIELREMISDLNSTGLFVTDSDTVGPSSGVSSTEFKKFVQSVEVFMEEQASRIEALSQAFIDEKVAKINSKNVNVVKVDTFKTFGSNFNKSLTSLSDKILQEISDRKSDVADCLSKVETLENTFKTFQHQLKNQIIPDVNMRPCPNKWLEYEDMCYYMVTNETVMWDVANMRCNDYGGILAEPESNEAVQFLIKNIVSKGLWLGLTDETTEGVWIFASSKKALDVDTYKWGIGQPNNLGGRQDCLELNRQGLNDETCYTDENNFVCQKNKLN